MDTNPNRSSILIRRICWSFVFVVFGAGSSFYLASSERHSAGGMLLAVGVYVGLYGIVCATPWFDLFISRPGIKRTIQIAYGIRMALSVIFPAGWFIDIPIGFASISIVGRLSIPVKSLTGTFLVTMLDGVLQHIVLLMFALVMLYPFARASALRKQNHLRGFEVIPVAQRADSSHTAQP